MFLIEIKDNPLFCLSVYIYFLSKSINKTLPVEKKKSAKFASLCLGTFFNLGGEGGPDVAQPLFLMALQVHN